MPSRVLASPQGPQGQVAESTASPTARPEEQLTLPVLQEVEILYETEYMLDSQGRMHLDPDSSEQYYIGQPEDASPSYPDFTMSGLASAGMLRDFLRRNLQPDRIVDEYGSKCNIAEISNDHLPVLQAKLWAKASSGHYQVKATTQRLSRAQNLIAGHVSKLVQLLEEKHIFVFSENVKDHACDYMSGLQTTTKHKCHSRKVQLEPLVHWGTLTPADPLQYTLPFRRNGELMINMDKPEFKLYVRQLVDPDAPSYCIDCLGYLWSKRGEAQDTIRQLQESVARPRYRFSEDVSVPRPVLKRKDSGTRSKDPASVAVGETLSSTRSHIESATDEMHETLDKALPQLDGACGLLDDFHVDHGNSREENVIWISPDSDGSIEQFAVYKKPLQWTESSTLPLRTPPTSSGHSTPFAPSTALPASTARKPGNAKEVGEAGDNTAKSTSASQVIDLTTPPRAKERMFGQELDINTKVPHVEVRRSPRKHKTDMVMSQAIRPAPVKPMKTLVGVQKAKMTTKQTKETKKRKGVSAGEQIVKQKKLRKIAPKESMPLIDMTNLPTEPAPYNHVPGLRRLGLNSPDRPQRMITSVPAVRASSPPKMMVHFAKRPAGAEVPAGIAEEEWQAYQRTHPAPSSKICICNKPACHGKFKKGEEPQIAQCVSRDCRFKWFHYACLDISEKGKARWGTLLCSYCRVEQELVERDRKNGWTAEKMTDFAPVWMREDIEAQLPGLGGVVSQANPYGLGLEIQLGPQYTRQIRETGTLGGLQKLGYSQSRPEMLEEAYLHAAAYAELLRRRDEEDEELDWEDEAYGDEEEDEDVYDEETDEEF